MNESECREIYREAFGDDGEFEDRLFSLCGEYCRTAMCGDKTAAILFALPCKIDTPEASFTAFYLYAAATKKAYRGKGHMSGLIGNLIKEGKPIFLKPKNDGLISFYENLGFKRFTAATKNDENKTAIPLGGFSELCDENKECGEFSYTAMCTGMPVDLNGLCFPFIME